MEENSGVQLSILLSTFRSHFWPKLKIITSDLFNTQIITNCSLQVLQGRQNGLHCMEAPGESCREEQLWFLPYLSWHFWQQEKREAQGTAEGHSLQQGQHIYLPSSWPVRNGTLKPQVLSALPFILQVPKSRWLGSSSFEQHGLTLRQLWKAIFSVISWYVNAMRSLNFKRMKGVLMGSGRSTSGWTECPCSHTQARGKWDSQSRNRELCSVRPSPRSDELTRQGEGNSKAWKRKGTTFP